MGTVDKQGVVTMQELLVSSLAHPDSKPGAAVRVERIVRPQISHLSCLNRPASSQPPSST